MNSAKRPQSFPLRLSPTIKERARDIAQREGVSFNHFVCLALAEKLSRIEHEHWLKRGKPAIQRAIPMHPSALAAKPTLR